MSDPYLLPTGTAGLLLPPLLAFIQRSH